MFVLRPILTKIKSVSEYLENVDSDPFESHSQHIDKIINVCSIFTFFYISIQDNLFNSIQNENNEYVQFEKYLDEEMSLITSGARLKKKIVFIPSNN